MAAEVTDSSRAHTAGLPLTIQWLLQTTCLLHILVERANDARLADRYFQMCLRLYHIQKRHMLISQAAL